MALMQPLLVQAVATQFMIVMAINAVAAELQKIALPLSTQQPLRFPVNELPRGCNVSLEGGPLRSDFPADFKFGTATAAYQIEGGYNEGGRLPSIWDVFVNIPGKIVDRSDGKIACDSYHKYEEDVILNNELGMDAYRFSIAWSRVLPIGWGEPNPLGIAYYNRLIDALVAKGISPTVTLYHWDLPDGLEKAIGGWLSPRIVDYFRAYADLCFKHFGDRVKTWITLNEPMESAQGGYGMGYRAPGRCSDRSQCGAGNSSTEAYLAAHHLLLSHSAAVALYRSQYQVEQGGEIGIVCNVGFNYPLTNSPRDKEAAERAMVFALGWFFDPPFFGDYPAIMHSHAGERLPKFTEEQKKELRQSADFLGLNYYTASYVADAHPPPIEDANPSTDSWTFRTEVKPDGTPIGESCNSTWLFIVPESMYDMLIWVKERYNNVPVIISENGLSEPNDDNIPIVERLCDTQRVRYHQSYLYHMARAIWDGANVKGYYAWSLLDNWEWGMGYLERFGIVFVDFNDPNRTRHIKASAVWWYNFLRGHKATS